MASFSCRKPGGEGIPPLSKTHAPLEVMSYTPGFYVFTPLWALWLLRNEPFFAKTGLGVKQNLPFFLSINHVSGPK